MIISSRTYDLVCKERAAVDLHYFARDFCKTLVEPEGKAPYVAPNPMLPHQVHFFDLYKQRQRKIVWEKSRRVMASWTVMMAFLWKILFLNNRELLVLSEQEKKVDNSHHTPSTLIGKVVFLVNQLRDDPVLGELVRKLEINYLTIHNPATDSTITGSAAGPNAGRGGGWDDVEFDEMAFILRAGEIYSSVEGGCYGSLIMTSTPNKEMEIGEDEFSRIRWGADKMGSVEVMTTLWHQMPGRDQEWYERKSETLTSAQMGAEQDCKYGRQRHSRCFYPWDRSKFVGKVPVIEGETLWRTWDPGVGMCAVAKIQVGQVHAASGRLHPQIRIVGHYENSGMAASHYRDQMSMDPIKYARCRISDVSDPYILDQRHSNLSTWRINLGQPDPRHPYEVHLRPANCMGVSIQNLIENACRFMRTVVAGDGTEVPLFLVDESLLDLIRHIEGWGFPTNRQGKVTGEKPNKDVHSHVCEAICYWIWDRFPAGSLGGEIQPNEIITAARATGMPGGPEIKGGNGATATLEGMFP